jgi:hypothetical protein
VGNHWLRQNGEIVVWGDGRAYLGQAIPPGATGGCDLPVRAPSAPGR